MVQLMSSAMAELKAKGSRKSTVKMEFDDDLSDSLKSLHKRPKLDSSPQVSFFFFLFQKLLNFFCC